MYHGKGKGQTGLQDLQEKSKTNLAQRRKDAKTQRKPKKYIEQDFL